MFQFLESGRETRSKLQEPEFLGLTLIREPIEDNNRFEIKQLYKYFVHDYVNFIELQHVDTGNSFMMSPVKMFCECPDFLNRCAKSRAADKSLFLNESIKERYFKDKKLMETVFNDNIEWKVDPNDIGICKHLIAAFEDLRVNFMMRSYGLRNSCVKFKNLIENEAKSKAGK